MSQGGSQDYYLEIKTKVGGKVPGEAMPQGPKLGIEPGLIEVAGDFRWAYRLPGPRTR